MTAGAPLRFQVAREASDVDQIFRLAYEAFVEEIPQHHANPDRRHIDRFHSQNTYLIAKDGTAVVGMIAIRGDRPFSLDEKLGSVDPYLPPGRRVCELRLLAVKPSYRHRGVFKGLVDLVLDYGRARGFDLAIISGTLRQEKLYRHVGFTAFGPRVGSDEAPFQPMFLSIERLADAAPVFTTVTGAPVSFLPGPVPVAPEVRAAFERPPISHRSDGFVTMLARVRRRAADLVRARDAQVLLGSGTLANDVVAAQLSLTSDSGVVASNGEFGDRLVDHARRARLAFAPVTAPWAQPLDLDRIDDEMGKTGAAWLWAVASETSTGMLNDVGALKEIAARRRARLCLDAMSAVGAVPIDLDGVWLATATSGKAIGAMPGLAMVFHNGGIAPEADRLPRYLDLGWYATHAGVPFTHSSNLVGALDAALGELAHDQDRHDGLRQLAQCLRPRLTALGLRLLVEGPDASPAILTAALPGGLRATEVAASLEGQGILVAAQSDYLVERNWLQIALMGVHEPADLDRLLRGLERILG